MPNSTSSAGLIKHLLYELKRGMQPLGIIEKKKNRKSSIYKIIVQIYSCMAVYE
jgi:hypothetical protein